MTFRNEIKNAIVAHARWKKTLRSAIETGKISAEVGTIKADGDCNFGKWLYGPTISEKQKNSKQYEEVRRLHALFHEKASKVAALALSGEKKHAERMLAVDGEFTLASGALTTAMLDWLIEQDGKARRTGPLTND